MRALCQVAVAAALLATAFVFGKARAEAAYPPDLISRGATLFEGACSGCHGRGAVRLLQGRPGLERSALLQRSDPRDTLKIVLDGRKPPPGKSGPYMPAFADTFRDDDLAELAAYLRARFTDKPAWSDLSAAAKKARAAK